MRRSEAAARAAAVATAACLWLVAPACAHAAITSVFNQTASPVPCRVLGNGVRLCDEAAFVPPRPRSTVKTFDGVPTDVRVAFPAQPGSGLDGSYPLMMLFPGYSGKKMALQSMTGWVARGYATLSMTDRGFGESCGTQAARDADPAGCANGYVRMMDARYEVRDAQELVARLVDDGLVDPVRIGATGHSYGGAKAIALAALRDRKMLPDGTLVPWTSAAGTRIALAAAAPVTAWTDMAAALVPNGSTLDYVTDAPYTGRTGVLKQSWENALYNLGLPFYYAPAGADPSADVTGWHNLLNAGEPYDQRTSNDPLPAVAALRNEWTRFHSAYYIDDSPPAAPLLMSNGWADDLAPADEALRFYNRARSRHPDAPISLFLADIGHSRGQNKSPDIALMGARQLAWMDYYVKGTGPVPFQGVETMTQTCPSTAPSQGPYFASDWAEAAPGEIAIDEPSIRRISASAGSPSVAQSFDPFSGGGACATAPATDQPGTATYRSAPVPPGGFTLLGSATVVADITSPGATSQIAARLLDVDPAGNAETLVARGLWRPAIDKKAVQQVFQLHPNGYRFDSGHIVKLELLPNDNPSYGRVSNGQSGVSVENLRLRLPVIEAPGSLGGLVQSRAAPVVPAGYALARDFAPAPYAQPAQATFVQVSLVPAFRQCFAPNTVHGGPLAFDACRPPAQASPTVTVGTPDANGKFPNSTGFAGLGVIADDPLTAAAEDDVRVAVSVTDVRRRDDLTDYAGELEAKVSLRITDRANGPANDAATVVDTSLRATLACAATGDPAQGSSCSVVTSANAIAPGAAQGGRRAVWELGGIEVYDGGVDGLASTTGDNELFARQGLFVP
jgi:predicted acyl esterase